MYMVWQNQQTFLNGIYIKMENGEIDFLALEKGTKLKDKTLNYRVIIKLDNEHVTVIDNENEISVVNAEYSSVGKYFFFKTGKNSFSPITSKNFEII